MGILEQLLAMVGSSRPTPVEWNGRTVRVDLRAMNAREWERFLKNSTRRNIWATLRQESTKTGLKLVVTSMSKGVVVGELAPSKLAREKDLTAALGQGVTVGVVRLTQHEGEPAEALLVLGKDYKYRPAPKW